MFGFKLPIYINGLIPPTRDMRQNGKGGGSNVKIFFTKKGKPTIVKKGRANSKGEFETFISSTYVGGNARIVYTHPFYIDQYFNVLIEPYGVLYTASIKHDFTFWSNSPSTDPEWDTHAEYLASSKIKDQKTRDFRYDNTIFKRIFFAVSILVPVGIYFLIDGPAKIIVGILFSLFMGSLVKYKIGLKRLF